MLLMRPPARRPAADVSALRARAALLHEKAAFAVSQLEGPPTGAEDFDAFRDKARTYAAARAMAFEMLLRLLDANAIPSVPEWDAWGDARRTADRLWVLLR